MSEGPPEGGFFPLVYEELRRLAAAKLAKESAGHTLDSTALVHEAYLKIGGTEFFDRSGFLRAAAVAMQRILVDHARRRRSAKRGRFGRQVHLDEADRIIIPNPDAVLDIDEALGKLSREDPQSADVARLRLFAGLSIEEAGETLGLSRATAFREWTYARSWITAALGSAKNHDGDVGTEGEPGRS